MKKLLIIGLLYGFCIAGCYTQKKAAKQIARAGIEYPELVLNACPAPKTETKYLPGKETHTSDTVVVEGKRIPCPPVVVNKDTVINWVDCPPSTIIHDTVVRVDTIYIQVTNTAAVKSLELQNAKIAADRDNWQGKAEKRGKWTIWLIVGLTLSLGWNFRKLISKMFV